MHPLFSQLSKITKLVLPIALVLVLLLLPFNTFVSAVEPNPGSIQEAPLNPEFVKYQQERATKTSGSQLNGYVPPTMDLSHLAKIPVTKSRDVKATLPAAFDWRTQGKVTPVKDQGSAGTCWIFGTLASLESRVAIVDNQIYDFSEQNLVTGVDPSWVYLVGNRGAGGNSFRSTDTLAKMGTRLESTQPYNTSTLNTEACNQSVPILQRVADFRIAATLATQYTEIKNAIYNYGPVIGAYRQDNAYWYSASNTYYWPNCTASANHMISIVGWDDNKPHPAGGGYGAWIVKNSWGTSFGESGYFYLCYGSANLTEIGTYHGDTGVAGYRNYNPAERNYYWDEAGLVNAIGATGYSYAWMRSIFTSTKAGNLTHVNFWATSNNAQYQIYVYDHATSGLLATKSGTCAEMGYYSIPLTSPVHLTTGQQFRIDVKMTTPGYNFPLPVEMVVSGTCNPPIQSGVCFIRVFDTAPWDDAYSAGVNVCLRATVIDDVVTLDASNIAAASARLNGDLKSLGGAATVNVSFEWGTSPSYGNTTAAQAKTSIGTFFFDLTGLNPGATYYYRAKAVGSGTNYGDEKSFTTTTTQYNLTMAISGAGATSPAVGTYTYYEGIVVNITATPAGGWYFDKWTGDVANTLSKTTTTVMSASKTVTANFRQVTPLSGKIAFSSVRDGNYEIYAMNADGTNQTRLTNSNSARDGDPEWSPDGTKIAFDSYWPGDGEIHVMNADGTNQILLTSNAALDYLPAWSPNGTKIAFVTDRDGNYEIYVMNADGTSQTRITNNPGGDWAPAWSPDGLKIAFMAGDAAEIYVMNADGTGRTRLTYATGNDYTPKWSPDGTKLVFPSYRDGNWEIYVMNADGSNQTRLTSNSVDDADPMWSPDGSKIAFVSLQDGDWEIYMMNADGSNPTRLTNNTTHDVHPSWAAGSWVAPTVVTNGASNITTTDARLNGALTALGSASTVNVSFQWGTSTGTYPNETSPAQPKTGTGVFSFDLTGLNVGTTYYYRAKAAGNGTTYGDEKSFATSIVVTNGANNITLNSARLNGKLTSLGTATSVNVSFQWGTVSGNLINETAPAQAKTALGIFSFDLTGLNVGTTYFYRAKGEGNDTSYGAEKSFTPSALATVDISVILQGGTVRPNPAGWEVPLAVKLFAPGDNVVTGTPVFTFNLTTSVAGTSPNLTAICQATNVNTGTYDVTAVSPHTLANVKRNVVISTPNTTVNMGTLLEGDANDSRIVNIQDFGIMAVSYGKTAGTPGFDARADFNRNGIVNIQDFGMLAINFSKTSPVEIP